MRRLFCSLFGHRLARMTYRPHTVCARCGGVFDDLGRSLA